jgi:3-deoxy-D-manno-octulosonic-acid transferase
MISEYTSFYLRLKQEIALFFLYQVLTGLVFFACFPFLLVIVLVSGKHRRGLSERLGLFPSLAVKKTAGGKRVWIHAASIGEINAARLLIERLKANFPELSFTVTTMTLHGRDYGRAKLGSDITCLLAPLDVPFVVDRFISILKPDVYVLLETELWPLVITKAKRSGAATILLNGRISNRSIGGYRRLRFIFKAVLQQFDEIGVIGSVDYQRFVLLGAKPGAVSITGNIKYDVKLPENNSEIRQKNRSLLGIDEDQKVFIAGSTHEPEEELLLPIYKRLSKAYSQLWLIAPRHLSRVEQIEKLLDAGNIDYDLFSNCKNGTPHRHSLVLVDTFGDLAELYSVASFVFIGGSFSNHGGHNLMEAAIWSNALFFGPFMQDFQEAADDIVKAGGAVCVESPAELEEQLVRLSVDKRVLHKLSACAEAAAEAHQQAASRQVELITRHI